MSGSSSSSTSSSSNSELYGVWRIPGAMLMWNVTTWPLAKAWGVASYFGVDRLIGYSGGSGRHAGRPKPFHEYFREKYVEMDRHAGLPFFEGTFNEAAEEAKRQFRFLLVYLHSEAHHNTDPFCRSVFQEPSVLHILLDHYVLWGASITEAEGYHFSQTLQATTYPYLGVIAHHGGQKQLVMIMQGELTERVITTKLRECVDNAGALLVAARADQEERENREKLRREQEREFEETQRRDRERLEARRKQEEEEQAQRMREEEERRQEAERLRLEQEKAEQHARWVEKEKVRKLSLVPAEPPAGAEVSTLKMLLFNGETVTRRFAMSDKLARVHDFVCAQRSWNGQNFELTVYPARVLDLEKTIAEENLGSRAVVTAKEV